MKNKKSYRPAVVIIILFLCLGIFVFLDMNKEDSGDSDVYSGSSHTAREEEALAEESPEEASSAIAPEATTESGKKTGGGRWPKGKDGGKGSGSGEFNKKDSTSATTEFDPDDHDIEGYYEDNKDEYDDIDDAYDGFEDDEEAWDDY